MVEITFGGQSLNVQLGENTGLALTAAATASAAAAAAQAGVTRYFATIAAGVSGSTVGQFFASAESGSTRIYLRTGTSPFYTDQGDAAAPLTKALANGTGGSAQIGTPNGTAEQAIISQPLSIREGSALTPTGVDWTSAINAALTSNLRVHIPQQRGTGTDARYGISGTGVRIVQNGTWLSFDRGARIVPFGGTAPTYCIRAEGAAPSTWFALSANAAEGGITFQLASLPSGWAVGTWIELRDSTVITGCPNSKANLQSCLRRITAITGTGPYTFTVHKPLPYTFTTAASAAAGKPTMIEDIIIERPTINDEAFGSNLIQFPIYLSYVAGARIVEPFAYGSKTPYGADVVAGDYIKLVNCIDIDIEDPRMTHGGYYGVSISAACEDIRIDQGVMIDTRHAVSIVWQTPAGSYGQPINILTHGMRALATNLTGYDTHDTGRLIRFSYCVSDGANDDGFQIRTTGVELDHCDAIASKLDGFAQEPGATGTEAIACTARNNGRYGVNWTEEGGVWIGGSIENSGSANNRNGSVASGGGPGFLTAGGYIGGGTRFSGNTKCIITTTGNDLLIDGVIAPADATQTRFLETVNSSLDLGNVRVQNSRITGYANRLWSTSGTTTKGISPQSSGNATTATATLRSGTATLVAGSVTIANTAFRNYAGASGAEPQRSKITVWRTANGGTRGALYVEPGTDQVGFDIKSTSASDTSTVRWEMSM